MKHPCIFCLISVLLIKSALLTCTKSCWASASTPPATFVDVAGREWSSTWSGKSKVGTWDVRQNNRRPQRRNPISALLEMNAGRQHEGDNEDEKSAYDAISCRLPSMYRSLHGYPPPKVWTLAKQSRRSNSKIPLSLKWDELSLVKPTNINKSQRKSFPCKMATETWNWCKDFVVPLKLCPWAKTSLEIPRALQFFLVSNNDLDCFVGSEGQSRSQEVCEAIIQNVSVEFQNLLQEEPSLASNAIFFVVFAPSIAFKESDNDGDNSFEGFYDWFINLEDWWTSHEENDSITLAPFHPSWVFGDDGDSIGAETGEHQNEKDINDEWKQLVFEKRSPYPTVTIVSSATIDQAGPVVTEQIGKTNYETLTSCSVKKLDKLWIENIFQE